MLVLKRKAGEVVFVGGEPVTVERLVEGVATVRFRGTQHTLGVGHRVELRPGVTVRSLSADLGSVRLGFEADGAVEVHRAEVWERIQQERTQAERNRAGTQEEEANHEGQGPGSPVEGAD